MSNITHNNHYLSQMYLKGFSKDNSSLNIYRVVAPHEKYPIWEKKYIKGFGSIEDIYTTYDGEKYDDELEKRFANDFENPSKDSLSKALNDEKLITRDLRNISKLVTIHIVRSPLVYNELINYVKDMSDLALPRNCNFNYDEVKKRLNFMGIPNVIYTEDGNTIIDYVTGKNAYLRVMDVFINKCTELFKNTRFSIGDIDKRVNIPTSDNPVVVISKDDNGIYGYDKLLLEKGSTIIFPISNNKIVYGIVGETLPFRCSFDLENSKRIKDIILDNPCNYFVSKDIDDEITNKKERIIDKELFLNTNNKFKEANDTYMNVEVKMLKMK